METHGLGMSSETICYIGEPDLRTAVIFLAAVKSGYKVRMPLQPSFYIDL